MASPVNAKASDMQSLILPAPGLLLPTIKRFVSQAFELLGCGRSSSIFELFTELYSSSSEDSS